MTGLCLLAGIIAFLGGVTEVWYRMGASGQRRFLSLLGGLWLALLAVAGTMLAGSAVEFLIWVFREGVR